MATLEHRMQVEAYADKSVREVIEDIEHLKSLHTSQRQTRRKIRDIIDGGPAAISALLGNYSGETPPVNNLIYSGLNRLAQKISQVPDLTIPLNGDSMSDRRHGETREDIVRGYDEMCQLDQMMSQLARWVPGYGFASAVVVDGKDWQGNPYPKAELRDPYDAYPSSWGVSQEPDRIAYVRSAASPKDLIKAYPSVGPLFQKYQRGGAVLLGGETSWEGNKGSIEVVEYIDAHGTWVVAPDYDILCDFIPNPVYPLVPFKVAKRFSFNKLIGQYDHVIGLMIANAKMNLYVLHEMAQSVSSPLFIAGQLSRGDTIEFGPQSVNMLEPGSTAQYLRSSTDPQMFQEIDRIERQLRVTSGYSVTDDAQSPNSFVTGRGLDNLQAGIQAEVEEYKRINRRFVEGLDTLRLAYDEKAYPNTKKPIFGFHNDEQGAPFYTPAKDIKGRWRTKREYGMLSGLDDPGKIVQLIQMFQAGWIDEITAMENIHGIDNIPEVRKRIEQNQAKAALSQALVAKAQGEDPRAVMALIELLPDDDMKNVLKKFYTPEGDELSPEEQAMAAPPGPAGPQDSTTVLSRLLGSGESTAGVQTVGTV